MADPIVDINSIKRAVKSGALLDPTYSKFAGGDSQYSSSNNYIADEAYKEAFKNYIKQEKDDLKKGMSKFGVSEVEVENPSLVSEYWRQLTNTGKEVVNNISKSLFPKSETPFALTEQKSPNQIRDEIVNGYRTTEKFKAMTAPGSQVKIVDGNEVSYMPLEFDKTIMDDADLIDRAQYNLGIKTNYLGNKKLSISEYDKNGVKNPLSDWFYYYDKDENGKDVLARTKIENYDKFKKQGKKILNAYGPTPFYQGFWREIGAGLSNTYSGLAANLVNVNRGGSNLLATALEEVPGGSFASVPARDYAKKSTEYGKQFQANYEINQAEPGQGGTAEWLGGGIGQGASSLAQMAILGTATGGLGRLIAPGLSATSKFQYLTNFGAGAILNFNEAYNSALNAGLSENEAASVGALTGAINGVIESAVGTNRLFNYLSGGGDRALARTVLNELGEDISERGINRVFNDIKKGLTGDAASTLNRLFNKPIVGQALEEGVEELFQTFTQKGVENLYDVFLANNKEIGSGKFGTKFFSKETGLEALEAAFFGAILGAGGGIVQTTSNKLKGIKSSKENDIIPMIADGRYSEVDAIVKTLHNNGLISDYQRDIYLERANHLNTLFQENNGTFSNLDQVEDKDRADLLKRQALGIISNTFDLSKETEQLAKELSAIQNNPDMAQPEKLEKSQALTEKIRQNNLNIKFFNDYITSEFKPREDGKINAYENSYLNQEEVLNNKWNRFLNIENIKELERKRETYSNIVTTNEELLNSEEATEESAKEIRQKIEVAQANINFLDGRIKERETRTLELVDEFNTITSKEYQDNLKTALEEAEIQDEIDETEVATTTPVDAVPEIKNENNSEVVDNVEAAPINQEEQIRNQISEIQGELENNSELDPDTINQLTDTLGYLEDALTELETNRVGKQADYDNFLRDNTNLVNAVLEVDEDPITKNGILSQFKKDIEQTLAGFDSTGIDTSALKELHTKLSNEILTLRTEIRNNELEQARLTQEAATASERDNTPLVSNISFFDRIERFSWMNNHPDYYNDAEFNELILNTPINELIDGIDVEALSAESLGLIPGSKVGTWNNNTDILVPKYIFKVYYNGQGLGNINQLDSFTVTNPEKDVNLTEQQLRQVEVRNTKFLAALRNGLIISDGNPIDFTLNWYGDFDFDSSLNRTSIKDFKPAQLVGKSGKKFYYLYDQSSQLEITNLVDTVQDELGEIPKIPEGLVDRYVVLVRANNGRLYWVGAQNQVLDSKIQNNLYNLLFDKVNKFKSITDEAELKKEVSLFNRYLESTIFVANNNDRNTQLQLTTPNKTNKGYTLALKGTKKRVELDNSKYGTISDLLDGLGLSAVNLRNTLPNNANIQTSINALSSNVTPQIFTNPRLSFNLNEDKLNDILVNNPVTDNNTENSIEIEESDNPFAGYDASNDLDPVIDIETNNIQNVEPISTDIVDLSQFDASFNELSNEDKLKVSQEAALLLEGYSELSKIKKKGVEIKVREIINKYRPATGDPVFSIGTSEEIMDYPQAIEWINKNLPSSIKIDDVNLLLGNIKNNGTTFGAFVDNIIYLSQTANKGTQYHEAFHAVFRTLISDRQITSALALTAQKYGRPNQSQLNEMRETSSVYYNYTDSQLSDLWLEEKMANDFQSYMNEADRSTSGIKSIWNKIKQWFNFITNNMDEVQALFYNIGRGKFKNASIQSNRFSKASNQDLVFSVFKKGYDENNNLITTTQLEGQAIVASLTNKLLSAKVNKTYGRATNSEILDILIAEKAKFYSIDENPYYETYLEEKGLIDDDSYIETMSRNLEQKRNIFVLPENIAALKKDVNSKIKLFDIDESINVDERQKEIDDIGEQFDVDVWTIGGETSFSKVLREYISLVTIKSKDEYGQDIDEAVDFRKVYRGLVRALAGVEEADILPRFKSLAEFDEDINAFYNTFITDLGLTKEGNIDIQSIKPEAYDLWRKFVTAFNNENVGWYTILHSTEQSRLIASNTNSAKDIQFNNWLQDFNAKFEESKFDKDVKTTINNTADAINRSENITVSTLTEAKERAKAIKNLFRKLSINLSDAYISYSLIKKSPYENLDQASKDILEAFAGTEGLYDGGNIPFIVAEFKSEYNPFISSVDEKNKERGAVNRLKDIAAQNALFDPTVGENSFQNADGKNVYSIIRPSFGLVKLRRLVNPQSRAKILQEEKQKKDNFIDPLENVTLNHILANENLDLIMANLSPSMIDGYRQRTIEGDSVRIEEGEGITFGKFNAHQYLLSDLLMFISNRKSLNTIENGKTVKLGESALFNINQMEASNTGYGVFLPVQDFSTVDKATDILFNYFAQEVIRVHKVKNEFGKEGTKVWVGYNDKQGARGFKLMEFAGYDLDTYVDNITSKEENKTAEDIYSELLYEKDKIKQLIQNKVQQDLDEYLKVVKSNNIVDSLPKIELIKRGYVKDGQSIDDKVLTKLITDSYLNSYINTLGINNLLLDNYAKKVKNTVDWYKRAKGIIGSGPDLGEGTTKVAVYIDPVKFIDTKTLSNIDKDDLINQKKFELAENPDLSEEDRSNALKSFEKDLNAGKIDIADAQSYVTLDHKILQLQRLGRFPKQVADIYEKIKLGQNITWDEKNILEDNNAALNSTKTVAYNGDYYFKLSELILSPNLVGAKDENGNVIFNDKGYPAKAKEGFEYLYNKYISMLEQGVDQALPNTASKMATVKPAAFAEDGKFDFTTSIMEIENKYKRLQVETPSGKSKIIHGTQLIQLVSSEQDDNLLVDFAYNSDVKTLGDLRRIYRQLLADNRYESFKTALAYVRDPLSGEFNSKALTKKFYETIVESGADEVMANFFTPDHNGERQFNWNLGPVVNKAEQLFLAHFSKGVLSQKVPGLKVSLVSDTGIRIKDQKTDKLRELQHMVLDADGNYYSECLLPAFANELLGKDPSDERIQDVLKMFGVRIPTDDKHSMMSLKVVGFLPVEYGSIGVFPKQIVYLSGADFDIDSEFIHRFDFYTNKEGIPVKYGTATTNEGKFEEYKKWNLSNNKLVKQRFKELGFSYSKATEEDRALVFKSLAMPSNLEEFIEQNPINIGVNNNAMLEAQIKFLTNDYVRTASATTPVSTSSIEESEQIVSNTLGLNNQRTVSPNTPLARFRANRSNMEGKYGIGPVALANTTQSLLTSNDVRLLNNVDLPYISGVTAEGFTSNFTISDPSVRKTDMLSALLNAMTDNAKLQLADKLTLTFNPSAEGAINSLPVAAYMLSIGYGMNETMLFINQALTRATIVGDIETLDKYNTLKDRYIREVKNRTNIELTPDLAIIGATPEKKAVYKKFKDENRVQLTIESMINSINIDTIDDPMYIIHLSESLNTFNQLKSQAAYTQAVSGLMSLNKGLGSTFKENLNLEDTVNKLQLGFVLEAIDDSVNTYDDLINKLIEEKIVNKVNNKIIVADNFPPFVLGRNINATPFDARLALLNDPNTIQNIIIYKKVMDASKEFFLLNTPVFQRLRRITNVDSKELIPFFMNKATKTFLEEVYPEKYQLLIQAESNAGYMIDKSGEQAVGRDLYKLKKDPEFRNNLLIKMLTLKNAGRNSKIVQIEFPTRIKAEGDFYTNLNNAFKELFMNPKTNDFARKLYYYSYFKDGLQFKNRSFINTIPSWVFKDVSTSLDLLNDDFKDLNIDGYSSIKEGLIPTIIDMFDTFTSIEKFNRNLPSVYLGYGLGGYVDTKTVTNSQYRYELKPVVKETLNLTNLDQFNMSIDALSENDADIEVLRTGINYDFAGYVNDSFNEANPEAVLGTKGRKLESILALTNDGQVRMTLAQVLDNYIRTGNKPIAIEVTYDKIIPIKEDGLNASLIDSSFINSYNEVIKVTKPEPSLVKENLAELDPNFEDVQIVEDPIQEDNSTPDLEITENNSIFVNENPFAGAIDDDLSAEDIAFFQQYQEVIDDSIIQGDILNELDANIEKFEDENGDPIC